MSLEDLMRERPRAVDIAPPARAEGGVKCSVCGGPGPKEVCGCLLVLERFVGRMLRELEANADKGGRCGPGGWVRGMTPDQRISELLYHCAKLTYAQPVWPPEERAA